MVHHTIPKAWNMKYDNSMELPLSASIQKQKKYQSKSQNRNKEVQMVKL